MRGSPDLLDLERGLSWPQKWLPLPSSIQGYDDVWIYDFNDFLSLCFHVKEWECLETAWTPNNVATQCRMPVNHNTVFGYHTEPTPDLNANHAIMSLVSKSILLTRQRFPDTKLILTVERHADGLLEAV